MGSIVWFICFFVAGSVGTVIDPGDEVILFDPSYETYGGCITMAGGIPVCFFLSFTKEFDSVFWVS